MHDDEFAGGGGADHLYCLNVEKPPKMKDEATFIQELSSC